MADLVPRVAMKVGRSVVGQSALSKKRQGFIKNIQHLKTFEISQVC